MKIISILDLGVSQDDSGQKAKRVHKYTVSYLKYSKIVTKKGLLISMRFILKIYAGVLHSYCGSIFYLYLVAQGPKPALKPNAAYLCSFNFIFKLLEMVRHSLLYPTMILLICVHLSNFIMLTLYIAICYIMIICVLLQGLSLASLILAVSFDGSGAIICIEIVVALVLVTAISWCVLYAINMNARFPEFFPTLVSINSSFQVYKYMYIISTTNVVKQAGIICV